MTSSQVCLNHPLVAAIDQCAICNVYLCGLCANFADSAVYCEGCIKNYEADKQVKATKAKLDLPKPAALLAEQEDITSKPASKSKINFRTIGTGFFLICTTGLGWSLYRYNQPVNIPRDEAIVQLERTQTELIQCLAIFAEIGQQLISGNGPALELRCIDTTLNNRVQKTDDELRVVHPNPNFYGSKAIYVTDKNPIPVVVPLDE